MTDDRGFLRRAALAAVGYIAIMAVGMFTAGHLFGTVYGMPEMVYVLVFFEAVMSIYAVVMARRIFGHWHCGFGPIDWRGMWWLLPNFVLMAVLFAFVIAPKSATYVRRGRVNGVDAPFMM